MPLEAYNDQNQLILSLCCIAALIISVSWYVKSGSSNNEINLDNNLQNSTIINETTPNNNIISKVMLLNNSSKFLMEPEPTCPPYKKSLNFSNLNANYISTRSICVPEDISNPLKHKIPKYYLLRKNSVKNNSTNENQNAMVVNCIIAVLLLTSLGAALLEFYRAKLSPPEPGKRGTKVPSSSSSRKCSLADLTVLKHQRKELVRRESILEQPAAEANEELFNNDHQSFIDEALWSKSSSSLCRRGSLPSNYLIQSAGKGRIIARNFRKLSITGDLLSSPNRRISVVANETRKLSILVDETLILRRDSLREDSSSSSPERRHHSRLVHRH